MAQIPYGYKIENGEAKPEPDKVQKLNAFIDAYLGGLSFKEARKTSGVELSEPCLRDYMRNGTFAGTDYYPPIVPEGTLERVQEEMARRTHPGVSIIPNAVPVRTKFRLAEPEGPCSGNAAEVASAIYDLIMPSDYGRTFMNTNEQATVKAWIGNEHSRQVPD